MANTTEYKCPSCGGVLGWIPEKGKLVCESCGNEYEVEAIKAFQKAEEGSTSFNWGEYKKEMEQNAQMDEVDVYICESCGAQIEADKNTVATACPYCGNNVILNNRLEGGIKPNAMIPFRVQPKDLPAIIQEYCKGKKLLPGGFFDNNKIGQLQGVYVPFWLFDCHLDGEMMLNATRVRTYRQGQYDCTETSYYLLEREGEMSFEKIPVDASMRMDNDLMDSIEPFDFNDLVEFDKRYLSGFLAERFDTDPDSERKRADLRMNNTAAAAFRETAPMYATVTIRSNNVKIDRASVKYVLLPVYLLNCTYQGKDYRYAINGQTGKVVGELPISNGKRMAWFAGVAGGVFAAIFGILQLLF